jgi:hypothetical protein
MTVVICVYVSWLECFVALLVLLHTLVRIASCNITALQLLLVDCFSRIVVGIALLVTRCYDIYGVAIDDEGVIVEPNPDQGMQDKLVAAWDCLQVRAALCLPFAV